MAEEATRERGSLEAAMGGSVAHTASEGMAAAHAVAAAAFDPAHLLTMGDGVGACGVGEGGSSAGATPDEGDGSGAVYFDCADAEPHGSPDGRPNMELRVIEDYYS